MPQNVLERTKARVQNNEILFKCKLRRFDRRLFVLMSYELSQDDRLSHRNVLFSLFKYKLLITEDIYLKKKSNWLAV